MIFSCSSGLFPAMAATTAAVFTGGFGFGTGACANIGAAPRSVRMVRERNVFIGIGLLGAGGRSTAAGGVDAGQAHILSDDGQLGVHLLLIVDHDGLLSGDFGTERGN